MHKFLSRLILTIVFGHDSLDRGKNEINDGTDSKKTIDTDHCFIRKFRSRIMRPLKRKLRRSK